MTTKPTAALALANGTVFYGHGVGATGLRVAELVFNTAMTGYQEILTDPSYAGQVVTFTFPHIGNTGTNGEDHEATAPFSAGAVFREIPTTPSNWRNTDSLQDWMKRHGLVGISGVDTRRLTRAIRQQGAPHVALQHDPSGNFDVDALLTQARGFNGLEGRDLAADVTGTLPNQWSEGTWTWPKGFATADRRYRVVAVDFGAKRNILRCLAQAGAEVIVAPANATAEDILAHDPDGVFLSNGPGDPAATGAYAVPMIQGLLAKPKLPIFGICLGHQLLGLALGAKTVKMNHGHHGANHPVKDLETGKVEITSMNHGFAVETASLPEGVIETHRSLFDGSNCGLRMTERPVFSVQYHPEASPGPQDSLYLFKRFAEAMAARQTA